MFIYFWDKEWGRGRERGRQRIRSRPCVGGRGPDAGLKLMNHEIMTWAKVGHLLDWATDMPWYAFFLNNKNHLGCGKNKLGYYRSAIPYRKILESSEKWKFINMSISDELLSNEETVNIQEGAESCTENDGAWNCISRLAWSHLGDLRTVNHFLDCSFTTIIRDWCS